MSDLRKRLGWKIRAMRQASGWSLERLAELADLHGTYIGSLEKLARGFMNW